MAVISFTKPDTGTFHKVYSWASVTEADTFAPVKLEKAINAITIQASGTFGGATVALHGSLDGTNYVALKDMGGTEIALTSAGLASDGSLVLYLKPVATGGASQSLNVSVMVGYLL